LKIDGTYEDITGTEKEIHDEFKIDEILPL